VAALMLAIGRQECIENLTFMVMWVAVSLPGLSRDRTWPFRRG